MDGADGGFCFRAEAADGGKVMGADEGGCRRGHAPDIERLRIEAGAAVEKRIPQTAVVDAVNVFLLDAGTDGVEILRRLHRGGNGDILRQSAVYRQRHALDGDGAVCAEIGTIAQGMDAGVRASAAGDVNRMLHDLGYGLLQRFLYGDIVSLGLPAVVIRAVVRQAERDISHSDTRRRRMTPAISAAPSRKATASPRCIFSTFMRVRPSPPL